jgi:NADH-quinone oxidoreductase E subunit
MRVLWLAQEKFGWLPAEVIRFVAETLDLPEPKVYGVATFYTQYYKEPMGKYVLDVCTCFSCQVCGGYDILHYLEEQLGIQKGGTTPDGLFSIQEVECLGACGSAPMLQVTNGPYVHNLTPQKCDRLLADLREGRCPRSSRSPSLRTRTPSAATPAPTPRPRTRTRRPRSRRPSPDPRQRPRPAGGPPPPVATPPHLTPDGSPEDPSRPRPATGGTTSASCSPRSRTSTASTSTRRTAATRPSAPSSPTGSTTRRGSWTRSSARTSAAAAAPPSTPA